MIKVHLAITPDELQRLYAPTDLDRLRSFAEVTFGTPDGEGRVPVAPGTATEADALVTCWSTHPLHDVPLSGSRLALIAHTAGSIRGLVPRELLASGMRVTQGGAAAMAPAVAELAVTLTLSLLRNIPAYDRALRRTRQWDVAATVAEGRSLADRTVGIVGLSRVGWHFATMIRGMGVRDIAAHDPYADTDRARELGITLVDLDELCARSEVLSIHAPSTPETHRFIGAAQLAALPDEAIVINTARSWCLDEAALLAELQTGRLLAGLDVFDVEPLPMDSPFYTLDNVLITPHVAGGTRDARFRQGSTVVDELQRFALGERLENEVSLDGYDHLA